MEIVIPPNLGSNVKAQHPWLDQRMRIIGSAALNNWMRTRGADIGSVLKATVMEFTQKPPVLVSAAPPPVAYAQAPAPPTYYAQPQPPQYPARPAYAHQPGHHPPAYPARVVNQPHPSYPAPPPGAFAQQPPYPQQPVVLAQPAVAQPPAPPPKPTVHMKELDILEIGVAQILLEPSCPPTFIADFVAHGLAEVKDKRAQYMHILEENEKIAASNLGKRDEITAAKADLQALQAHAQAKYQEYDQARSQLAQRGQENDKEHMREAVQAAADEIDEECRDLVNDFVFDDMELRDFEKAFLKSRTLYHARSAKLEQAQEL